MEKGRGNGDIAREEDWLVEFIAAAREDARITAAHISLYVSLWTLWKAKERRWPVSFFSRDLMPVCKISSFSTYHKILRQLHEYGYIRYEPSFNHYAGSLVEFVRRG